MAEQNFQGQELPAFKEMEVEPEEDDLEEDDLEEDDPEEDDPEEDEAEKTVPKEALPNNSPPSKDVAPQNSHASEDTAPQKSPSENAAPRNSPPPEDAAPQNSPPPGDAALRNSPPPWDAALRNSPPPGDAATRNYPPSGDAATRKSPPPGRKSPLPGDAAPRKSPPPGNAAPRKPPPPGDAAPRKSPPPEDAAPQKSPPEEHVLKNSRLSEESAGEKNDVDVETKRWPGWPGENVFRLVVPVQRVGGIIGRKGEYIKKICEETKARIKILDGPPGTQERTILISAKEEPDLLVPPAVDGLLKIHKHIVETDTDPSNALIGGSGPTCTRLLVAGSQAGSLIGKQGATVKSIQDDSHCSIRFLGEENVPVFALPDDSVVEIQGEPGGVQKAVELIATHLRKFLVDRSIIGVFETVMQSPNVRANQMTPHSQSWGPTPPAFAMNHGGHGYGPNHSSMAPHGRQFDNYRPPEISSLDKPPRGIPSYGRDFPAGANTNSLQPQQAVISKVTQNMQIPLSYADAIIGINGANISYIRRASGATIAIQETRGVPGEMTVEINGSSSQVQAAQQLIQNYIADAVSNAQNHPGPPVSQGYNPYQSHGPVYASAPSNPPGQGYAPTGDYYGASYGY